MKNFNSDINPKNYYGLALEIQDEKRLEKFQNQRSDREFDETEWYSLNNTILSFALPRLKEFKIHSISYPCDMTCEEWDVILDKMISEIEDYLSGTDGTEPTLFFNIFHNFGVNMKTTFEVLRYLFLPLTIITTIGLI